MTWIIPLVMLLKVIPGAEGHKGVYYYKNQYPDKVGF